MLKQATFEFSLGHELQAVVERVHPVSPFLRGNLSIAKEVTVVNKQTFKLLQFGQMLEKDASPFEFSRECCNTLPHVSLSMV